MRLNYLTAITVLLILLVGVGWHSLSLQRQVEVLSAQNQGLQSELTELRKALFELRDENLKLRSKVAEVEQERQRLAMELDKVGVRINLLIDFSNGTRLWFNNTLLPYGSSLLNATLVKAQPVRYTVFPMGIFVDEIMGVANARPWYWLWWKYRDGRWVMGETGADAEKLRSGGIYAWKYSNTGSWPPEPP